MDKYILNLVTNELELLEDERYKTLFISNLLNKQIKEFISFFPESSQEKEYKKVFNALYPIFLKNCIRIVELPHKEVPYKEIKTFKLPNNEQTDKNIDFKRYVIDIKTGEIYIPENYYDSKIDKEVLETIALEIWIPEAADYLHYLTEKQEMEAEIERLTELLSPKIAKERLRFINLPTPQNLNLDWTKLI